jgi:hypothetical protein
MHGLQGSFPHCKKRLPSDKEKCCHVLECIVLVLHNFWMELVGPEYEQVININGYDRIRKYYLQPDDYETDDKAKLMEENFGNEAEDNDF